MEVKSENKIRFFDPYIGEKYGEGINGKKVLVLGASFYCLLKDAKKANCTKHSECTNYEKRMTHEFDEICPMYKEGGAILSEEPDNEVTSCTNNRAYGTFGSLLKEFLYKDLTGSAWDYVSFTNYIQFMQPDRPTLPCYLSEQDYLAFKEVLKLSKPDVVIVWGDIVKNEIKKHFSNESYSVNKDDDKIMYLHEMDKQITLAFVTHPSAVGTWEMNLVRTRRIIRMALDA